MKQFDELTRRQFISNAARSYLGVSLAPLVGAGLATPLHGQTSGNAARAKSVIFLNMAGGMSHMDTFDPKPKSAEEYRGPVKAIGTNVDGIQFSEYLPKTAGVADNLCVINSMNVKQGTHEQGQYLMHRSYPERGTIVHPSLGAWVNKMVGKRNKSLPGFVSIGGAPSQASGGFFGAKYTGVYMGDPSEGLKGTKRAATVSEDAFDRRLALADALNQKFHDSFASPQVKEYDDLYVEAIKLMRSDDLKAFDLGNEPASMREKYGKHHFGQGCLLARRLVEHEVRYVEVTMGGWDTHYDNFGEVQKLTKVMDTAYAALISDLKERGLLDSTLVVLSTEFGRTPKFEPIYRNGRGHFPAAYSAVLAGAGVKAGTKYGETDKNAERVEKDGVTPQMLNATIAYALGINTKKVETSPSGRPFRISNGAKPVTGVFS